MVVVLNTGVASVAPVPNVLPAAGASYQVIVPPLDVASNVTVPDAQRDFGEVVRIQKPSVTVKGSVRSDVFEETKAMEPVVAEVVVGAGRT